MAEKTLKFLFETTVLKQIEEKVTEKREEGGSTIEVTKTIKKAQPVKIAILKPNRRIYEQAEIFYAKQIAFYIKEGLLPHSLVAKRYSNDGGALSEPEKQRLLTLEDQKESLEKQFFGLAKEDSNKNNILIKLNDINAQINIITNSYAEIYQNTAESKAQNKTMEWWVLNLSYIDDNGYKPLFGDGNDAEKLAKYDEFEEADDLFTIECIRKLSYLISFWSVTKNGQNAELPKMDKLFDETLSEYKTINDATDIKIEDKTDTVIIPNEIEPIVDR